MGSGGSGNVKIPGPLFDTGPRYNFILCTAFSWALPSVMQEALFSAHYTWKQGLKRQTFAAVVHSTQHALKSNCWLEMVKAPKEAMQGFQSTIFAGQKQYTFFPFTLQDKRKRWNRPQLKLAWIWNSKPNKLINSRTMAGQYMYTTADMLCIIEWEYFWVNIQYIGLDCMHKISLYSENHITSAVTLLKE